MQQKSGFWQSFYDQLASIKLTVIILIVIAAGSLIGTLIPQGLTQEQLVHEYGPRKGSDPVKTLGEMMSICDV